MVDIGRKLFATIHKQKRHANPNHDVHFMARELDNWLVQGVESMVDGSYTPRHLKRHYFTDEMVDQLHLSDRIFQNILLKQLKTTFPYVMNSNCYHLHGPSGVRLATQRIRQVLLEIQNTSSAQTSNHFTNPSRITNWFRTSNSIMMIQMSKPC